MKTYSMNFFRRDFFGGVTAGVIALPLALAFGVASGAGAAAGLYGAIILGFFASVFGGTRLQVSGPTGPITVVIASALTVFSGDFSSVLAVIVLAGVFQIILGLVKLGGLVKFMPYPVISGFMSGIGVIIITLQIEPILGVGAAPSPLKAILGIPAALPHINPYSFCLALLSMAIVFLVPKRITRIVPSPLMALLFGSVLAWWAEFPVSSIGDIPAGLPQLQLPSISLKNWNHIILLAATLAFLGSIDSLLTSLVSDSLTKERHNSNRELIGQGIGNMLCGFFGGIAGAGATMRTVINIKAGAVTRMSGIIHSLFLLSVLLGLGDFASHIPMAVLAGILVKVGVDILDYRLLKVMNKAPKNDLRVMAAVFFTTVFVDLIVAVVVGIVLSAFFLINRMAQQMEVQVTGVLEDDRLLEKDRELQLSTDYRIRIVNIMGPFFFGTTTQVVDNVDGLLGTRVIIFNCLNVPFMDISGLFALEEMLQKLKEGRIIPILVVKEEKRKILLDLGFQHIVGERLIFTDQAQALHSAQNLVNEQK